MKIAFYAPMNDPNSGPPSGDRVIARQVREGLEALGHEVELVCELCTWSQSPDDLARLREAAAGEVQRLLEGTWDAWVTYHVYYKAPDLIGPWIARSRGLPYFVVEGSLAPSRKEGPWAEHYALTLEALSNAAGIFCVSQRDRPALEDRNLGPLHDLPPFIDVNLWPQSRPGDGPMRLVTTAMMRKGDKLESYRLVAECLIQLEGDWTYDVFGDGPARSDVEALFVDFGDRVRFRGIADQKAIASAYSTSDLFLWPGIGEGLGMAFLEAQAAGLPVLACNEPGPLSALTDAAARFTQSSPAAYGWALADLARDKDRRTTMGKAGRRHVMNRFGREQFLRILRDGLLIGGAS